MRDDGLLTLDRWDRASESAQLRFARALVERVAPKMKLAGVKTFEQGGQRRRAALFGHDGARFAFVPGGLVRLGFEPSRFAPSPEQAESYRALGARFTGLPADLRDVISRSSSLPRERSLPPLLVEVSAREVGVEPVSAEDPEVKEVQAKNRHIFRHSHTLEIHKRMRLHRTPRGAWKAWRIVKTTHAQLSAAIATAGMRLLTSDEWEYACAGGSRTLFHWGDDCPCDRYPSVGGDRYKTRAARPAPRTLRPSNARWNEHRRPNAFGLSIAQNPYDSEVVAEKGLWRGGDGGWAIHGGLEFFMGWLPLATAFLSHFPDEPPPDDDDLSTARVRRAIAIEGV